MDTGTEYRILLDVPGAHDDGIEVVPGSTPGTLSICARVATRAESEGKLVMGERASRGGYEHRRLLAIAWDADVNAAKTSLDAGVLTVVIPKKANETRHENARAQK